MNYEFQRIGADNFEKLIQSLVVGMSGIETMIFGDGPDGQREALIEDASFKINTSITACGMTIVQAKYKSADGKQNDWEWLRVNLKKELEGFKKKKETHSELVPNSFLFFTNIVLTPVLDSGIHDKAEKFIKNYKDIIPNIHIFGADDIRCMLDNNRNVARAYTSYIMPGDVLYELDDYIRELKNEKFDILIEYARQMFREDSAVRLEQAGSVSNKSINLHNVYTDIEVENIGPLDGIRCGAASHIVMIGNKKHDYNQADVHIHSRIEKEDLNNNNIVLLGNAGQGKSTLCQYICQIYRAALLKRYRSNEINVSLYNKNENNIPDIKCERFPIHISLRNYAAWINKQDIESNCSIISYIISDIKKKTNSSMEHSYFRRLLSGYSWIFFFDGLDEVPVSSNRVKVLQQINTFVNYDLVAEECDSVVVCTSRIHGYDNAFSDEQYSHFMIQDLSHDLCLKYIDKLLLHIEDNSDKRAEYRKILKRSLDDAVVSKLMTTPLYVAIIVLLVKMGGTPPTKRYDLFFEYCDIVIRRELQKEMLPSLNGDNEWIKSIHSKIGFYLQLESENAGNAAAEMKKDRCIGMLSKLIDAVEEVNDLSTIANKMYHSIVNRLPFLSETTDSEGNSCVVFPLRSIQEYFAAEWLITFSTDDSRAEALELISMSSYWRNVFLFVAGYYSKNRHCKMMNNAIFGICQHYNGNPNQIPDDTEESFIFKEVMLGAHLALDLIDDNLFNTKLDQQRYLILLGEAIEKGIDLKIGKLMKLPASFSRKLLENTVIPFLQRTNNADFPAYEYLWDCANGGDQYAINELDKIIESLHYSNNFVVYRSVLESSDSIKENTVRVLLNWTMNAEPWLYFDYMKKWLLLVDRIYKIDCSEQLDKRIIRTIIYFFLHNTYLNLSHDFDDVRIIRENSLLDKEYKLAEKQSTRCSPKLLFQSITGEETFNSIAELRDDYIRYGLWELVALAEYIVSPTYTKMVELFEQLNDLPEIFKDSFIDIIRNTNWLFEDIVERYRNGESIVDILDDYKSLYNAILEDDKTITAFLNKEQIEQIVLSNYIDKVIILVDYGNVRMILDKRIDYIVNKKCNSRLISTLYNVYGRDKSIPFLIMNYCLSNISTMLNDWKGVTLLLDIIGKSSIRDLMNCDWKYPKELKYRAKYIGGEIDLFKLAKSKINSLIRIDQSYVEAYSIFGVIGNDYCELDPYDAWERDEAIKYLDYLKKKNNYLAIVGCISKILNDGLADEMKQRITDELIWLLKINEDYTKMFIRSLYRIDIKTKLFMYKALSEAFDKNDCLLPYLRLSIQDDIVSKPVDQVLLCELSDKAHDY